MGKIAEGIKSIISGIGRFFKGLFKKEAEVKNVTLLSGKNDNSNEDKDRSILGSIWDSLWDFVWELIGYLGWYKRAESPSNPGKQETLDSVINYEIINYINDVSLENAEVLMTSDMKGNYTSAYTYGLDRISVDNLKVVNNIKTDPLYYLYDGRGSVTELVNRDGQVTGKNDYEAFGITDHVGYLGNVGIHYENYYGYNGENYNERSGLQYLRARYYEPETGTFLTRDSYLGNIMNPLSQNRYSYAENNPIMNVDPSGHIAKWIKNLGSAIKSTVTNVVSSVKSFATKVVTAVKNTVSTVATTIKQVFTRSSYNKITSTVSNYYSTNSERNIIGSKNSIINTSSNIQQKSTPKVNAISLFKEIGRKAVENVKKACEGVEYLAGKAYEYKEQVLDVAQVGLDIAGMAPAVGIILDGVNGVISLARGRKGDAALNFASMIPVAGLAAGAGKLVSKGSKAVDLIKLADNTTTQSKLVMNLQNFGSKGTSEVVEKIAKNSDEGTKVIKNSLEESKTYQTYTKTNRTTGEVYSGRTSGTGTPAENISKRDGNHHMNDKGFGPAELDKTSSNKNSIRGREQQLIEAKGGAKSQGGTSGNSINGIGPNNKKKSVYLKAAEEEFK